MKDTRTKRQKDQPELYGLWLVGRAGEPLTRLFPDMALSKPSAELYWRYYTLTTLWMPETKFGLHHVATYWNPFLRGGGAR